MGPDVEKIEVGGDKGRVACRTTSPTSIHADRKLAEEYMENNLDPAPQQGSRDNDTKPRITMVLEATRAIEGIARVLEFGAKKYARRNWMQGLKYTEIMDSQVRHQLALLRGENLDPESGLPHADHIACNALFLSEMMYTRPDMDDRCTPVVHSNPSHLSKGA